MAHYRKIDTRIWNDAKFREFSDDAKLVWLHLLTHPQLTPIGAIRATPTMLAIDLGWDAERYQMALAMPHAMGLIMVANKAPLMTISNFVKYNKPDSIKNVQGWAKCLESLPECPELFEFVEHVKSMISDHNDWCEVLNKALPMGHRMDHKMGLPKPMNNEQRTMNNETTACAEQTDAPLGSGFLFSTKTGKWELSDADYQRLVGAYQTIDVDAELRKAALWLDGNKTRLKTDAGMLRFLSGWMNRAGTPPPARKQIDKNDGTIRMPEPFGDSWEVYADAQFS